MTETIKNILEISTTEAPKYEQVIDSLGRSNATGKRKNAIARVWIKKGTGKFTINGIDARKYLKRAIVHVVSLQPLVLLDLDKKIDIIATSVGGGLSGQAGAIRLGISRALVKFNPENHKILRDNGFLTRDSRIVERKKPGLKKARKGQTYRKR
jgi:small subunit ribosomal protein S9